MSFVPVIHSIGWIVAVLQRMSTRNPRAQNPFNEFDLHYARSTKLTHCSHDGELQATSFLF